MRRLDVGTETRQLPSSVNGLVYRYPVTAEIIACRDQCPEAGSAAAGILLAKPVSVLTAGREAVLPIERRWFGGRTTNIEFDESGSLSLVAGTGETDVPPSNELAPEQ